MVSQAVSQPLTFKKLTVMRKNSIRTKQQTPVMVELILNICVQVFKFCALRRGLIASFLTHHISTEQSFCQVLKKISDVRQHLILVLYLPTWAFLESSSISSSSSSSSSTVACFPFLCLGNVNRGISSDCFHFLPLSTPHEYLNERYWVSAASATNLLSTVGL